MVGRPNTLSIDAPTFVLGISNARTTGRRPRTCGLAPMEAASRLARLRSDLAAAAGPSLGSAKEPALTPVWRRLTRRGAVRFKNEA
jgi:hypothetical protein